MTDKRTRALQDVDALERLVGMTLSEVPVHAADQWTAGLRDVFAELGADLRSTEAARSAFAGAYVAVGILSDGGYARGDSLTTTAHMLRWLYDRGEETI